MSEKLIRRLIDEIAKSEHMVDLLVLDRTDKEFSEALDLVSFDVDQKLNFIQARSVTHLGDEFRQRFCPAAQLTIEVHGDAPVLVWNDWGDVIIHKRESVARLIATLWCYIHTKRSEGAEGYGEQPAEVI